MVTRIVQGWREINTTTYISGQPIAAYLEGQMDVRGVSSVTYKGVGAASNVAEGLRTTIFTVVADDTILNISNIVVSGEAYAKYFLVHNNTDLDIRRSGPDRNLEFDFKGSSWLLNYGDIVDVQVEHCCPGELLNFGCTVYGYGDIAARIVKPLAPEELYLNLNEPTTISAEDQVAVYLTLTVNAPLVSISETNIPTTFQLALASYDPTVEVLQIATSLVSFMNIPTPWPMIHSFPATLPAQLIPLEPVTNVINHTDLLELLMDDIRLDRRVGAAILPLTMGDIRLDRTHSPVTLPLEIGDIILDSEVSPSTLHLEMSDVQIDKTLKPVTLELSVGEIILDRTLNPETLKLLMSDPLLDRTLKPVTLHLDMSDVQIDKTLKPVTLQISLGEVILDRTLNPVTLEISLGEVILDKTIQPVTLVISLGEIILDALITPPTLEMT